MPPQRPRTLDEARENPDWTVESRPDGTWDVTYNPQAAAAPEPPSTPSEARAQGLAVRKAPDGTYNVYDDPPPNTGGFFGLEGPAAFINKGIESTATMGLGEDWLNEVSRKIKINIPEREPEGFGEVVPHAIGQAAGVIPLLVGGVGNLARYGAAKTGLGQYLPAISRAIRAPFIEAPGTAIATEVAAGAGAGAGQQIASDVLPPGYEELGNIVGGGVAGIGSSVLSQSALLNPRRIRDKVRGGAHSMRDMLMEGFAPYTKEGAKKAAGTQVRMRVANPKAIVQSVARGAGQEMPGGSYLSPAQSTGDPNLLAMERHQASQSPVALAALDEQINTSQGNLAGRIESQVDAQNIESLINNARTRANDKIEALGVATRGESSAIYDEEFASAYRAAKEEQLRLWTAADDDPIPTENLHAAWKELLESTSAVNEADLPAPARRFLGDQENQTGARAELEEMGLPASTIDDAMKQLDMESADAGDVFGEYENQRLIHDFVSKMGDIESAAAQSQNRPLARAAGILREAGWRDLLGSDDAPTTVSTALRAARAYSRDLNQTFRTGSMSRISNTGRTTTPIETLGETLGTQGGERGIARNNALNRAIEFGEHDPTRGSQAIDDYLMERFLTAATANGTYSATQASGFLRRNRDLLRERPHLLEQMNQATQGLTSAEALGNTKKTISAVMGSDTPLARLTRESELANGVDPRVANAGESLDRPDLAAQIKDYDQRVEEWNQASRSSLMDFAAYGNQALDELGNRIPNGKRMLGLINQPKTRAVFERFFDVEDLDRLAILSDELKKIQMAAGPLSPSIAGGERPLPRGVAAIRGATTLFARIGGMKAGAYAASGTTGATLSGASKGSEAAGFLVQQALHQHADKLLLEAMSDPVLFNELMSQSDEVIPDLGAEGSRLLAWAKQFIGGRMSEVRRGTIPTLAGTGASMVPATEQYLPGDEERTGTMADILPSLNDRIQRGQTLTGDPLARR